MGSANLFFAKHPSWKYIRNRISPFFTSGKMKQMYGAMCSVAEDLDRRFGSVEIDTTTGRACVEVSEIFASYTTDIIARTAFGVQANCLKDPDSEFRRHGREMFDFRWYRAIEFTSIFFFPQIVSWCRFKVCKMNLFSLEFPPSFLISPDIHQENHDISSRIHWLRDGRTRKEWRPKQRSYRHTH